MNRIALFLATNFAVIAVSTFKGTGVARGR